MTAAPPIQFAHSVDGASIAYSRTGSGPPLLEIRGLAGTIESPVRSATPLLGCFDVVRIDRRGSGNSTEVPSISLDLLVADLIAVADHLRLETFHVLSHFLGCFEALTLAAKHPDRVRGLIFRDPYVVAWQNHPRNKAWLAAIEPHSDWSWSSEAFVYLQESPTSPATDVQRTHIRDANSPEAILSHVHAFEECDATAAFAAVQAPAMVIHQTSNWMPAEWARSYARSIRGTTLVVDRNPDRWSFDAQTEAALRTFLLATLPPGEVPTGWGDAARDPAPHPEVGLSEREREVLRLAARGLSNAQIASALTVSLPTVATHLRHIFEKVGVENRAGAAAWAVREGLG